MTCVHEQQPRDRSVVRRPGGHQRAPRAHQNDLPARRQRPANLVGPGLHHFALVCSDVEQTVRFYQDLLEFPLTEIFENRDYPGSNHFFFDVGHGNLLAFFDFPGLDIGPYQEVFGGLHHIAISVTPDRWAHLKAELDDAGVEYLLESKVSIYFRDPDGARLEFWPTRSERCTAQALLDPPGQEPWSSSPSPPGVSPLKISLHTGHTGKRSGLRLGSQTLPHNATTGSPDSALSRIFSLRT